jgi:tetratricopeptide (TPR) repeat protein
MVDLLEEYRSVSRLADSGEIDEALNQLNRLIDENSGDMNLWVLKGMILKEKGDSEGALQSFDKAMNADAKSPWPHFRKAELLWELERLDEALSEINKAIDLRPEYYGFWQEKGLILEDLLHAEDAFECFGRAVLFNESAAWSWFGMSRLLVYMDSINHALEACDKAISIEPGETAFKEFKEYLQGKIGA